MVFRGDTLACCRRDGVDCSDCILHAPSVREDDGTFRCNNAMDDSRPGCEMGLCGWQKQQSEQLGSLSH